MEGNARAEFGTFIVRLGRVAELGGEVFVVVEVQGGRGGGASRPSAVAAAAAATLLLHH